MPSPRRRTTCGPRGTRRPPGSRPPARDVDRARTATGPPPTRRPAGSLRDHVSRIEGAFVDALAERDVHAAVSALLELDETIERRVGAGDDSPDLHAARATFRSFIVRLGDVAVDGTRDPRDVVAPFVEALLERASPGSRRRRTGRPRTSSATGSPRPGSRSRTGPTSRPGRSGQAESGRDDRHGDDGRANLSHARPAQHARGLVHLGHQHAVPARCGLEQRRGLRGQRLLHRGPGAVRGPDRCRRRHARSPPVVPARGGHPAPVDPAVPRHVAGPRSVLGLGARLDPARTRVHVLLRGDRGVARRRPRRDGLHAATSSTSSVGPR